MAKRLKIGIIGVGGIARGAHIPATRQSEDKSSWSPAPTSTTSGHGRWPKVRLSPSLRGLREMLEKEKLDAVSVCTPNKFHAPATIAALEAGCHVLCEKPPALTTAEAQARWSRRRARGKSAHLWAALPLFAPRCRRRNGSSTGASSGTSTPRGSTPIRRRGIPGWGVFTNKELQGGGPVIDIGVHMLDTCLYLMGYPKPVQVLAKTYQEIGNRPGVGAMGAWDWENFQVEDLAMGMIKFDNGATILLETIFCPKHRRDGPDERPPERPGRRHQPLPAQGRQGDARRPLRRDAGVAAQGRPASHRGSEALCGGLPRRARAHGQAPRGRPPAASCSTLSTRRPKRTTSSTSTDHDQPRSKAAAPIALPKSKCDQRAPCDRGARFFS